jgi:hypothetical protein
LAIPLPSGIVRRNLSVTGVLTSNDSAKIKMKNSVSGSGWKGLIAVTAVLVLILAVLFAKSFQPGMVHHSNDGPLGNLKSDAIKLPEAFQGYWVDLHWIGSSGGAAPISITYLLLWILGPVGFAKFYPPLCLLILGLSAWTFFRTIGLSKGLSAIAAIAAALNSNFFSNTAWGLGTRSLTLAISFLALALLSTKRRGNPWWNAALAGLCVGMGIIEGADNGAIFSVFIGAFVLWQAWIEAGPVKKKILGGLRVVVVAAFAAFMAAQVLITLVSIASQNVRGPKEERDPEAKTRDWDFATQWSLPPAESLRVIIPGLYGYRMDTPEGGNYWGRVGEAPGAPQVAPRYSGAGEYAGVLVVLVALWGLFASFSKSLGVFSATEQRLIGFWAVMAFVALLLSWGRHAPFYQFVYALPYFKTIRNPMKFMHPGHMAIMVLFGYGLLGLSRRYLTNSPVKATLFEKRWKFVSFALAAAALLSFLIYTASRSSLEKHLMNVGFGDPTFAAAIARFSVREVGLFVLFLLLSVGALFLIIRGSFAGSRGRWAIVLLGLLVTVDLARANQPWIIYWNYPRKYASNPIIDLLKEKPYEGRVVAPSPLSSAQGIQLDYLTRQFLQLYGIEWVQHHFQYYNIQSIDVAQDPRPPADKKAYLKAVGPDLGRYCQLTNTRWVLGLGGYLNLLNSQVDKGRNRFRIAALFEIAPKPDFGPGARFALDDLTAVPTTNGPLALFEYTAALPRAKLYPQWLVLTNGEEALAKLTDPAFDPASAVILSENIPGPSATASNPAPATVEFVSYAPKKIELKSSASVPTMLLLNDRYDPAWNVWVDDQPTKLLRANYIMRGVPVPAGQHTIRFRYEPSVRGMKITLAALVFGLLLCGYLALSRRRPEEASRPMAAAQTSTRKVKA